MKINKNDQLQKPVILNKLSKVTYSEQQIINFINNYEKTVFALSQRELAKATFTSEPTVSRLIKKLGYINYRDFTVKVNHTIALANKEYPVYENNEMVDVAKNIINTHLFAIADGFDDKMVAQLISLGDKIDGAKKIIIYGTSSSTRNAEDFAWNLQKIGKEVVYSKSYAVLLSAIAISGPDTIVIGFSDEANSKELGFLIERSVFGKLTTVLITGNLNPLAEPDVLIHYRKLHVNTFDVPISSKTIQGVICDMLFQLVVAKKPTYRKRLRDGIETVNAWKTI